MTLTNTKEESRKIVEFAKKLFKLVEASNHTPYTEVELEIIEKYERIISGVCEYVIKLDMDMYSDNYRGEIQTGFTQMISFYTNLNGGITTTNRQLLSNFETMYNEFVQYLNKNIPFNTINNVLLTDVNNTLSALLDGKATMEEAKNTAEELKKDITEIKDEIAILVLDAKEAAGEIVIVKYGTIFRELSQAHKTNAMWWLIGIGALVISVCVFSFITMESALSFIGEEENAKLLKYNATMILWIGTRLVAFSALFIGIGICIRNYKANKHNEVLNKHRQNALSTFEAFVKSSGEDKGIKDAILMEVTRTIFATQNTGFSSADVDAESPSKIIEIIKNVSGNN